MSRLKLSILIFLCAIVSACTQLTPFEDRRREPGTQAVYYGSSRPGKPAICYNPLFYSKEDILERANKMCQEQKAGTHAEYVDTDYFSCRLLIPSKAYYKCVVDK